MIHKAQLMGVDCEIHVSATIYIKDIGPVDLPTRLVAQSGVFSFEPDFTSAMHAIRQHQQRPRTRSTIVPHHPV